MNTSYDMDQSTDLIAQLIRLTRESKIEWLQKGSAAFPEMARYQTTINGDSEAQVWSTNKQAGFKIFEKRPEPESDSLLIGKQASYAAAGVDIASGSPLLMMAAAASLLRISERDLVAISIDHEKGPAKGEIYVNLMSLLELARRSADKIEPKVERLKQYLEKLAV